MYMYMYMYMQLHLQYAPLNVVLYSRIFHMDQISVNQAKKMKIKFFWY